MDELLLPVKETYLSSFPFEIKRKGYIKKKKKKVTPKRKEKKKCFTPFAMLDD